MRETLIRTIACCLVVLGAMPAAAIEPIEDLQWLFIEDTVALISPPTEAAATHARELMERAATARGEGKLSEMRRALAEARVVLAAEEWTAASAFVASLAIRPHETVIDADEGATVEIGQYFQVAPPSAEALTFEIGTRLWKARPPFSHDITWRVSVRSRQTDFAENPLVVQLPTALLADGVYDVVIRAVQSDQPLGTSARRIFVAHGLRRDLDLITQRAAKMQMSDSLKASIAYPIDVVKGLNARTRQVRNFDPRAAIDRSLALLDAVEKGSDPLTRSKGSSERHYWLAESERYEPYRLIIPQSWDGTSKLPLVVTLHGSNGDHDSVLANQALVAEADRRGYALLSPMGYSPNSGWGTHLPVVLANGTMPRPRPSTIGGIVLPRDGVDPEPAERDVLRTLELVQAEYPIDTQRIYLMGNSMGGEGTWHLGSRYPHLWAAIAPAAGAIDPKNYPVESLGRLPVLAVHGDKDPIISHAASREMIERLQGAKGNGRLLTVKGGGHDAVNTVLADVFDFFSKHRRRDNAVITTR